MRKVVFLWALLLGRHCQAVSVATVGDSFADSLYNAIRSRPDLVRRYDVQLVRWSRPIIGLTRTDYFDYTGWLRDSAELGRVDVCFVQIGSNDMQSIPAGARQWIAYGSAAWREAYARRTRDMAQVLTERRCGQVVWVLQPGFEKRDLMACHRELINEVQSAALRIERTRVLEAVTSEEAYGVDKTHFSRAFLLQLGPPLFQVIDTSRQIAHAGCLACHRNIEGLAREPGAFPLRPRWGDTVAAVWAPERAGVLCRNPAPRRVTAVKRVAHRRRG